MEPRPKLTMKPRASSLALDAQHNSPLSAMTASTTITTAAAASNDRSRTWTRYQLLCLLRTWRLVVTMTTTIQSSPALLAKLIYEQFTTLCKRESISDNEDWSESEVQQICEALVASYQFIKRFNASGGVGGAAGQRVVNWFVISEREQLSIVDERFGKECEFIFGIDEATYDMIGLILDEEEKRPSEAKEPVESSTPSAAAASEPSVPSPTFQDSSPAPTVVTAVTLDSQPTASLHQVTSQPAPSSQPTPASPSQVLSRIKQLKQRQLEKEVVDREANLPSHIWRRGELFRLIRVWKKLLEERETLPSEPTQEFKDEVYERFCEEAEKETGQNGEEPIPRSFQATWSKVVSLVRSYEFIQDFNHDRFHWMTPSVRIPKPESWFELSDSYQQWVAKKYFKPRNKRLPVTFTYVYSDMMDVIEVNRAKSLAWWTMTTSEKQNVANANPAKPTLAKAATTQPRLKAPSPRNNPTKPTAKAVEKVSRPRRIPVPSPQPARHVVAPTTKKNVAATTAQPTRSPSPPATTPGKVKRGRKPIWREGELLTLLRAWSAAVNEHPVPDEKLGDESFDTHVFVKFVAGPGGNAKGRDLAQVRVKLTSLAESCAFISDFNANRISTVTKAPRGMAPAVQQKSWFLLSEVKQQKVVNNHFEDHHHGTAFTYVTKEMMPLIAKNAGIELSTTPPVRAASPAPVLVGKQWSREELVKLLQAWFDVVTRRQPHDDEGTLLSRIYTQFQLLCSGKSTWPASTTAAKKSALMASYNDLIDYFTQHYMGDKRRAKWFAKSESARWELMDAEKKAQDYYEDFDAEMFALMEKIVDAENQVGLASSGRRLSREGASSSVKQARATGSTAKAARAEASSWGESRSLESEESEFDWPRPGKQPADLRRGGRERVRRGGKRNSPSSGHQPADLRSCIREDVGVRKRVARRKFGDLSGESRAPGDLFSVQKRQRFADSQASAKSPSVEAQQHQQQIQLLQSMLDQMREERDFEREERRREREERRQEREETKRELEQWRQERLRERESFQTLLREFGKRK